MATGEGGREPAPESVEQNIAKAIVDGLDGLGDWWERGGFDARRHPADDTGTVVRVRWQAQSKHGRSVGKFRKFIVTVAEEG